MLQVHCTARIFLLAILSVLASRSAGQFSTVGSTVLATADPSKCTTYVLPTGNVEFDQALYAAVHANWTLSPIGDLKDLGDKVDLSIPQRTYIVFLDGGLRRSLALVRGGSESPLHDLGSKDILATAPIGSVRNENTIDQCAYRIPLMVAALQQIMELRIQDEMGLVSPVELNRKAPPLRPEELLVEEALLRPAEVEALKAAVGRVVRLADRTAIEKAIDERQPGTALLVPVFGQLFDLIVYDLETRKCVFLQRLGLTDYKVDLGEKHLKMLKQKFEARP